VNRRSLLIVSALLVLLLLGIGAWQLFSRQSAPEVADAAPATTELASSGTSEPSETDPFDPFPELGGAGPTQPTGPPPKRIVEVPDNPDSAASADAFDWSTLSPDNLMSSTVAAVAAALDGNLRAADLLVSVQQHCRRMPEDESSVARWARRATEYHERSGGQRSSFGLFEAQATQEGNEAQLRGWMAACQDLRKVWDDSISAELARLAEQGSVSARLLFAMFPPTGNAALGGVVPFSVRFSWEALAREYSMLNLQAGAPEGFLAFGQSYLGGLFTPHDWVMGAAFLKAAMECGETELVSGGIVTRIENSDGEGGSWRGGEDRAAQMLTYYDGIIGYCR